MSPPFLTDYVSEFKDCFTWNSAHNGGFSCETNHESSKKNTFCTKKTKNKLKQEFSCMTQLNIIAPVIEPTD